MADAKMLNKAKIMARMRAIPDKVAVAVGSQLADEVEQMVDAMKAAAPVDPNSEDPGRLRDGLRFYPNPDRPLSYRIINDAKDDDGGYIAAHVEHGTRRKDGTHVAAQPSFFPIYRSRRGPARRRLNKAAREAIRAEFPPEGGSDHGP